LSAIETNNNSNTRTAREQETAEIEKNTIQ